MRTQVLTDFAAGWLQSFSFKFLLSLREYLPEELFMLLYTL